MEHLGVAEGDVVHLETVTLPKGKSVVFKPVDKVLYKLHNPKAECV